MHGNGLARVLLAGAFGAGAEAVVRGVNLGGWLVTEPWLTPSLFEDTDTDDEWHLCAALGKEKCKDTMEDHYSNFYTRDDLEQIKDAGLTAIRIPLGYWAVDLEDYEPYVSGSYRHLLRAVRWAQDLDLKVMVDLHGAPGSQNGYVGSGLSDVVLFPNNQTNTDRSLKVLRNLTEEFSKETYGGVVTNIELLNEPLLSFETLKDFYTPAANIVGAGNSSGINTTYHDGFYNPHSWANYDPFNDASSAPAEHTTLDTHQFWAFPPLDTLDKDGILEYICNFGRGLKNGSVPGIPPTLVGEWSLSTGITGNSTTDAKYDQEKRTWFRELFESQNAAFTPNAPGQATIGWYFWTWKTEYDIDAWSYRKGLAQGYIPSDISDPSTYEYPIKDNGCIDISHDYTAPATVTSTAPSSSRTSGGGSGGSGDSDASTTTDSSSSSSPTSGANSILAGLVPSLAVTAFAIFRLL